MNSTDTTTADLAGRLHIRLCSIYGAAECLHETARQMEPSGLPLTGAARCLADDIGEVVAGLSELEDMISHGEN